MLTPTSGLEEAKKRLQQTKSEEKRRVLILLNY